MQTGTTSRVSFGLPEVLRDDLDDLADQRDMSRSELLRELVKDELDASTPDDNDEYHPQDDALAAVYQAALEHSIEHQLRFDLRKSQMATDTGIAATALRGYLVALQRDGYVKHQVGDALGNGKSTADFWRVKPACANPRAWRYSDAYDPEYVARLEEQVSTGSAVRAVADD